MIELGTEDIVPESKPNDFAIRGRSIRGDVERGYSDNRQPATAAQFTEATDAVLNVLGVHAVRWEQYTTSWNDGEPCTFNVHELAVRFSPLENEDDARGDMEDGFIESWNIEYSREDGEVSELSDSAFEELERAMKEWDKLYKDEVCRQNFGESAQVTATLEGFSVDSYDHD